MALNSITMKLNQCWTGTKITLQLSTNIRVEDLKLRIAQKLGVQPIAQSLMHRGVKLKVTTIDSNYGFDDGDMHLAVGLSRVHNAQSSLNPVSMPPCMSMGGGRLGSFQVALSLPVVNVAPEQLLSDAFRALFKYVVDIQCPSPSGGETNRSPPNITPFSTKLVSNFTRALLNVMDNCGRSSTVPPTSEAKPSPLTPLQRLHDREITQMILSHLQNRHRHLCSGVEFEDIDINGILSSDYNLLCDFVV